MDELRSEISNRMQQHAAKLTERENVVACLSEQLETRLDEYTSDIRAKMNARLDELSHNR